MTPEARDVMFQMIKEISQLKYFYKRNVDDCFDYVVKRSNLQVPIESKEEVVNEVLKFFKSGELNDQSKTS